ncbi:MAG: hypothetical protein DCC68_22335 [Planctomycetota bacterium]|nr:MAG: hypothetical protein DCC68_22335 [Planctomycetota bacterium]
MVGRTTAVLVTVLVALNHAWTAAPGYASEPPSEPSAKPTGIAAKYPGDTNIAKDANVLFVENFESDSVIAVAKRWDEVRDAEGLSFAADVPEGSSGKQSLLFTHVGGKGTGSHLYRRLEKGHDRVFARFYVKFGEACAPVHHFGTCLGGNNPPTRWPSVKAGVPTAGDKAFWTGVEPFGDEWRWDFYTYWCEMRGSPPRGQTWGNSFVRDDKLNVERGRWICVEMMVKLNDVGDTNGEQAMWIDGKQVSHLGKGFPKGKWTYDKFTPNAGGEGIRWDRDAGGPKRFEVAEGGEPFEGFRWRTAKELNVNFVWAYVYITKAPAGHVSKVWFDDIVVATEYIGPIAK